MEGPLQRNPLLLHALDLHLFTSQEELAGVPHGLAVLLNTECGDKGTFFTSFHPKDFSELNLLLLWPGDSRGESIRIDTDPIAKWDQYLEDYLNFIFEK